MKRLTCGRLVLACALLLAASAPCLGACTVSTTSVAFSPYDVFNTLSDDITGTITIRCRPAAPFTLSLSAGAGTYASRAMKNGTNTLNYNLFTDPTRLTIWGDGSAGTVTVSGNDKDLTYTVYGRIPARQNVRIGSYTDTIIVTITY